MTDLDEFAKVALMSIMLDDENYIIGYICETLGVALEDYKADEQYPKFCAILAYRYAGAMMEESLKRHAP